MANPALGPIGVFDSGVGGLTVARAIRERLPNEALLYLGDTARLPYGTKSPRVVERYAQNCAQRLIDGGAKALVIACNTASSIATADVLERFDVPIFEVITPAVKLAVSASKKFRFGVIGTRATITSGVYEKKIREMRPAAKIYSIACPLLVPLVEEGWLNKPEAAMIVKKYLHPLKTRRIDTLILGCTHYPLLKKVIQRKAGKQVHLIDSSISVAGDIKAHLEKYTEVEKPLGKNGKLTLFVSDITEQFEKIAVMTLKTKVKFDCVKI